MASSLFQDRNNRRSNAPDANGGLLAGLMDFAKGITSQEAEKRLNSLLASGQMSKAQFNSLAKRAKEIMTFFGLK